MSWFGSGREDAWSRCIEELDYETDAGRDLAADTLSEMERLGKSLHQLRSLSHDYEGDALVRLATELQAAVQHDMSALVNDLRRALDAAQQIGRLIDSTR